MREQGRSEIGIASLPHVKLAPLSAPGSTGERQEHLDAILLNTQLMFLKKEKDPNSKQFDDEWIRSVTEAQEITADVPEDSFV